MATLLEGKKLAKQINTETADYASQHDLTLAVIQVGDDPASGAYREAKKRQAHRMGIVFEEYLFDTFVPAREIESLIRRLNSREEITGIFIEQPLPRGYDILALPELVDPVKDIDGVTTANGANLYFNRPGLFPATAEALLEILDFYGIDPKGKEAVIVGRSNIVGKPAALLLLHRHATVTICHSRTRSLEEVVRRGDIVIAAVGKAELLKGDFFKEGAVVLDAGYNMSDGKTAGDVDFEGAFERVSAITPVPGGVGSVTTASLFRNLVKAHQLQYGT